MGATKFEVVRKVVFPAALSGIMASIILAMSRAIGETMAVSLAVGDKPQLTFDPTESVQTMTAFIAQIAIGETAQGSIQFKSLFAVGADAVRVHAASSTCSAAGSSAGSGRHTDVGDDRPAAAAPAVRFEPALMRRKLTGTVFYGLCLAAVGILLLALVALLVDVLVRGLPWLDWRLPDRRRRRADPRTPASCPRSSARSRSGIIVGVVTFPIGVAAAIYLDEYASDSWVNRLLQTNISNLAGVPSIIYGILGLAVFVRLLGLGPTILAAGADADPAHPAGRDHRLDRGPARPSRTRSARAPTRSARPAGRWSAARSCRPPRPGS